MKKLKELQQGDSIFELSMDAGRLYWAISEITSVEKNDYGLLLSAFDTANPENAFTFCIVEDKFEMTQAFMGAEGSFVSWIFTSQDDLVRFILEINVSAAELIQFLVG